MGLFFLLVIVIIAIMLILYFFYIHFENYISLRTKLNLLGYIPLSSNSKELIIQNNSKTNIMEYIKDIRTKIIERNSGKVISIFSSKNGEGKSWISNNLAVSLARIDKKVLLIDCDLRKISNKGEIFFTPSVEGLSDFLRDIKIEDTLSNIYKAKKYIKQTQIPNLFILQNGTITKNSSELLKSNKMHFLINILKEMYDYIILDGTSILENDDFLSILGISNSCILVAHKNISTCKDIIKAKSKIANGKILGFILNKTNSKFGKYYGKNKSSKIGLYLESPKDQSEQLQVTMDEIISPLVRNIEKNKMNQFERLHKELRDNILIEDFINDIEINYILKLDEINKNNLDTNNQITKILQKFDENNTTLFEKLDNIIIKEKENNDFYNKSNNDLIEQINNLKSEIENLRSTQNEQNLIFEDLLNNILTKNFDKQFEDLQDQINNINFDNKFDDLQNQINNINFDDKFNDIEENIKKMHINKKLLYLKKQIDNKNFDEKFKEIENQIKNQNYDEEIEKIKLQIQNINFDDKFNNLEQEMKQNNFSEKIDIIKDEIKNLNIDSRFEELKEQIKNQNLQEKFEELNEQVKSIKQNNDIPKKKSNIINLEKLFIENGKSMIFPIENNISYEDLEKNALDTVYLEDIEIATKRFVE